MGIGWDWWKMTGNDGIAAGGQRGNDGSTGTAEWQQKMPKIVKEERNSGVPGFWISGDDTVPGRSPGWQKSMTGSGNYPEWHVVRLWERPGHRALWQQGVKVGGGDREVIEAEQMWNERDGWKVWNRVRVDREAGALAPRERQRTNR
jgi:hypothetical protein